MEEGKKRGKSSLKGSFVTGAIALVFLIIGYEVALFVHRAAVTRIEANRDHPDTVYIVQRVPEKVSEDVPEGEVSTSAIDYADAAPAEEASSSAKNYADATAEHTSIPTEAISREDIGLEPRRCLLCGNEVRYCMRAHTHTQEELLAKIEEMVNFYLKL